MASLGAALLLAACSSGDPFEPLAEPVSVPVPTSTTAPRDFSKVVLTPVEGSTTTTEVVVGPGPATLAGQVNGPDGPVPGAVVRLERLVGDASAALDVTTGADGAWQAPNVLGGRYRIRAWRSPDLALVEPQILFVETAGPAPVVMVLERFETRTIDTAIAPDPPRVGAPVNVRVRISLQLVDENGVVRARPQPGVAVTLGAGSGWQATSPLQVSTDDGGGVTFTLICRASGPQPLTVTLPDRGPAGLPQPPAPNPNMPSTTVPAPPPPEAFDLPVPDCVAPPPTSVPTAPSTSLVPSEE